MNDTNFKQNKQDFAHANKRARCSDSILFKKRGRGYNCIKCRPKTPLSSQCGRVWVGKSAETYIGEDGINVVCWSSQIRQQVRPRKLVHCNHSLFRCKKYLNHRFWPNSSYKRHQSLLSKIDRHNQIKYLVMPILGY